MCERKQVLAQKVWYYGNEAFHGFHFPLPEAKHPVALEKAKQTLYSWAILKEKHGWLYDLAMFLIYYGGTNNQFLCDLIRNISYNNRLSETQVIRGIQVACRYIPTSEPAPAPKATKATKAKARRWSESEPFPYTEYSSGWMEPNFKEAVQTVRSRGISEESHGWLEDLLIDTEVYKVPGREEAYKTIKKYGGLTADEVLTLMAACATARSCTQPC
jgi:hypothetical protein